MMSANPYNTSNANPYNSNNAGGFMTDSGINASPASKKKTSALTIRSVTIKQILDSIQTAADSTLFTIDNVECGQVSLVGLVRQINEQSTNTSYRLDDGTGVIDARLWTNSTIENNDLISHKHSTIRENLYAKVVGTIRSVNSVRGLSILAIHPIDDFNQVTYSLLDAIATHLYFTRGLPSGLGKNPLTSGSSAGAFNNQHLSAYQQHPLQQQQQQQQYSLDHEFTPIQHAVMNVVKSFDRSPEGVNIQMLLKKVTADGFPFASVKDTFEFLLGEGHIYQTSDDHCKSSF